jgi:cell division transport system permease protein
MHRAIRLLRRAGDALWRDPFVTAVAVGTIFVAVLVTGLAAGALRGGERLLSTWASQVPVSVYLAPGADLAAARRAAELVVPGLQVVAVTPEEALRRLRASLGDDGGALEGLGDGALPASLEVRAPDLTVERARALAAALRRVPGAAEVDDAAEWLARLDALLRRARAVGLVLLAVLAVAAAVLVSSTLRLAVYARRDEIEIMKLVGATDAHVGAPFLIEGLLQGLVGALVAVALLSAGAAALVPRLAAALPVAAHLTRGDLLPGSLVAGLLAGGAGLGVAASALSLRRFLRRPGP